MKYRIDAFHAGKCVKQGSKLIDSIEDAIKLAKAVAMRYHCYTKIARVVA